MQFSGVYTSLATPFDHRGELYPAKIRYNVSLLNKTALSGYAAGAWAGEGALLSSDEKRRLFDEVRQAAGEGKTLLAGTSCESVAETAELCRAAAEIGFHAALARPPREYANLPGAEARALLYLRGAADRSPIPLLAESPDENEACPLSPASAAALAEHPNIAGLVVRSRARDAVRRLLDAVPEEFPVLLGAEGLLCEFLGAGAKAALLTLSSAVPLFFLSIEEAMRTREPAAARELTARASAAAEAIATRFGAPGLKQAMDLRGCYGGPPRLPLTPLGDEEKVEIGRLIEELAG